MSYKELKSPCKEMLEKNLCLGCSKLELENFEGDENCRYVRDIKNNGICNSKLDSNNCYYDFTLYNC